MAYPDSSCELKCVVMDPCTVDTKVSAKGLEMFLDHLLLKIPHLRFTNRRDLEASHDVTGPLNRV